MKRILATTLIAITVGALACAQTLKMGDPAPELAVAKWIKGEPVTKLGDGKVNVVEFWATWCGPCKVSIPHLTELAKKYGDKVTFTGVSVWENGNKPFASDTYDKVSKFVTDMGDKMDYRVAADGPEATMAKTWMEAAGQNGIPTAFVVGGDGKVLWIGHPMVGLEQTLDKVIAGNYDINAEIAKKQAELEQQKAFEAMLKPVSEAYEAKKWDVAVTELDKVMAKDPKYKDQFALLRYSILLKGSDARAYPYAKELANGMYKDNAPALNQMAWSIVDDKSGLTKPDYATAVYIAEKAVAVSASKDASILDTLAYAYYKKGDVKKAIETEEKAMALLANDASADPAMKKEVADRLAMMKAKKP